MEDKYLAIRDIILKNVPDEGCFPCAVKGVKLVRRNSKSEFLKCFYNSTCIFVLQGKKQAVYGSNSLIYTKGQYVVSCTDIPVTSRIIEASPKEPFVVMILEFDTKLISDLILETKMTKEFNDDKKCLAVADTDEGLLDAFYRLSLLIENPQSEVLCSMVIKEIYYRLLIGPLGNQLRMINTIGTRSNQIAQAIGFLKENYKQKLNIENIAEFVNMAPSSFYRNFRKVTQISPLQYQKQLRLYEAQRLMLSGDYNAESAAFCVGYESPTQFSREYKKMFGMPPKTDVLQHRFS